MKKENLFFVFIPVSFASVFQRCVKVELKTRRKLI